MAAILGLGVSVSSHADSDWPERSVHAQQTRGDSKTKKVEPMSSNCMHLVSDFVTEVSAKCRLRESHSLRFQVARAKAEKRRRTTWTRTDKVKQLGKRCLEISHLVKRDRLQNMRGVQLSSNQVIAIVGGSAKASLREIGARFNCSKDTVGRSLKIIASVDLESQVLLARSIIAWLRDQRPVLESAFTGTALEIRFDIVPSYV